MLIELTLAGAAVMTADQASKALILSRSAAPSPNARFFSIRKVLARGAPASARAIYALLGLWVASVAIAALLLQQGVIPENATSAAGIGAALGRARRDADPVMRKATYRVRPAGRVGTAANLIAVLADGRTQ